MKKIIVLLCLCSIIIISCNKNINIDDKSNDMQTQNIDIIENENIDDSYINNEYQNDLIDDNDDFLVNETIIDENSYNENIKTFNSKEELYYMYFSDFYDYIVDYRKAEEDLKNHNINSKDDFYIFLKTFEGGVKGFNTAATLLGKYYLRKDIGGSIYNQNSNDGFVGYCIDNNIYINVHEFFVNFFANYRMDEGYTGDGNNQYIHGSDFLAIPNDSIVDIIKYFYYDESTLPNYFSKNCETRKLIDVVPNSDENIIVNKSTHSEIFNDSTIKPNKDDYFGKNKDEFPIYCVSIRKQDKERFHYVALTFDSGVNVDQTKKILDILDEYDVKATFFMTYNAMKESPEYVKKIVEKGHEIANHSMSHPDFTKITKEQIEEEIKTPHEFVKQLTNVDMNLFRFPYGSYNEDSVKAVKELGYYPIQWSHDSQDWKNDSLENIILRTCVDDKIYSGSIILFHNGPVLTPLALPTIIAYIKEKGYKFAKVSDLIYQHDFYLKSGKQYKND